MADETFSFRWGIPLPAVNNSRGQKCEKCGRVTRCIEEHHIVPRSEGGSDEPDNVQLLCPTCHRETHLPRLKVNMYGETPEAWAQARSRDYTNLALGKMPVFKPTAWCLYFFAKRWTENADGEVSFTAAEAAQSLGCSGRNILKALNELVAGGAIIRLNGGDSD